MILLVGAKFFELPTVLLMGYGKRREVLSGPVFSSVAVTQRKHFEGCWAEFSLKINLSKQKGKALPKKI